jgi:hypothetical protein
VRVVGPGVGELCRRAWRTHCALLDGNWGILAVETPGCWIDPEGAAAAFAATGDATIGDPGGTLCWPGPDEATFTGRLAALVSAIEVWQRIQIGQFGHAGVAYGTGWAHGDELNELRNRHGTPGAWPARPGESWGVAHARNDVAVTVAYDIWKLLGGGVPGRVLLSGVPLDVGIEVLAAFDDAATAADG